MGMQSLITHIDTHVDTGNIIGKNLRIGIGDMGISLILS